jgi:predicted acyl esterase
MARGPVNSDVMVRARDGIGLATDVYLPDGPGPFPTVLTRLPYGKTEAYCAMPVVADLWNRRGYAAVVQDVRGKWGSEGVFEPNLARNEISDGHDTVARSGLHCSLGQAAPTGSLTGACNRRRRPRTTPQERS